MGKKAKPVAYQDDDDDQEDFEGNDSFDEEDDAQSDDKSSDLIDVDDGGDDDDIRGEQRAATNRNTAWGKSKKIYYKDSDDSVTDSDKEEEEEKEALEILKQHQQRLRQEDFIEDLDAPAVPKGGVDEQEDAAADDTRRTVRVSDLPETQDVARLLVEVKECAGNIVRLQKALDTKGAGGILRARGVAYAKMYHDLLVAYLITVLYYLELRKQGVAVKNHPVLQALLQQKKELAAYEDLEDAFAEKVVDAMKAVRTAQAKQPEQSQQHAKKSLPVTKKSKKIAKKGNTNPATPSGTAKGGAAPPAPVQQPLLLLEEDDEDKRIFGKKKAGSTTDAAFSNIQDDFSIDDDDDDDDGEGAGDGLASSDATEGANNNENEGEDEFYKKAKELHARKQQSVAQSQRDRAKNRKQKIKSQFVDHDIGDEDSRKISYQILNNKGGLYRRRKKVDRNSRVKGKVKYDKALQKRKTKGIFVRDKPKKAYEYGGDTVGIKSSLVRGVQLK